METLLAGLNWWHVPILMAGGVVSGLVAGIFGIGGGTVLVPLIVLIMDMIYQLPSTAGIKIGIATSLACIALSSSAAVFFQKRIGVNHFLIVRPMLLPIVIGVLLSVLVASFVPGSLLRYAFAGYLLLFFVVSIAFSPSNGPDVDLALPLVEGGGVGFGVGLVSGLLGIGGAFIAVQRFPLAR